MKYSCQIEGITNRWVYYAIIASFCNAYKSVILLLNATFYGKKYYTETGHSKKACLMCDKLFKWLVASG